MGDVARKEEPSNAEAIGAARMEAIDRHPVDPIVTLLADDLADALVNDPSACTAARSKSVSTCQSIRKMLFGHGWMST